MTDLKDIVGKYGVPDPSIMGKIPKGGISLDYVGHAEITRILIDIDPLWSWEPCAFDVNGRPGVSRVNDMVVMWGRLTVLGKTLLGVGSAKFDKQDLDKELIGDFLRNSSMRFGIALSLWSKAEWEHETKPVKQTDADPLVSEANKQRIVNAFADIGIELLSALALAGVTILAWDDLRESGRVKLLTAFSRAKADMPPDEPVTKDKPRVDATITPMYPPIPDEVKAAHPSNGVGDVSKAQIGALKALLRGGAYSDAEQLEMASDVAGRIIESFDELTKKEASSLITILKAPKADTPEESF